MILPNANTQKTIVESIQEKTLAIVRTTPGKMQLFLILVSFFSLLFSLVVYLEIGQLQRIVKTVGHDSVPSIVAAEKVRAGLADMEANAANSFFSQGAQEAKNQYNLDIHTLSKNLVTAAKNITYGAEEEDPIDIIAENTGIYEGIVAESRALGYPKGLKTLDEANALMDSVLIKSASDLDAVNYNHLNIDFKSSENEEAVVLVILGVILLGALGFLQFYFLKNMHRIVNIPLAIASVLVIFFLIWASYSIRVTQEKLREVKQDAFDSVHALYKAKSIAYEANACESLYLLDIANHEKYQKKFNELSGQLAQSTDFELIKGSPKPPKEANSPLLEAQIQNITFPGEEELTRSMMKSYAEYMSIDEKIRQYELANQHQDAVLLCTGNALGQSNHAFDQFNSDIDNVIELNMKYFNEGVATAEGHLAPLSTVGFIVSFLVILLSIWGIYSRWKEYYS